MKTNSKHLSSVIKAIQADKELSKAIHLIAYYDVQRFIDDATRYINAVKSGRMLCVIKSVSRSGMSRVVNFSSCEGTKHTQFSYYNYSCLFTALGYKEKSDRSGFTVSGCGMDMVFHVNYTNMHVFERLGLITKDECRVLAQETPVVL